MHHLRAILPIPHLLRLQSANAAARLRTLPPSSQVLMRTPSSWEEHSPYAPFPLSKCSESTSKPPTVIHHLANLSHPNAERLMPYHTAPWERHHRWGTRLAIHVPPQGRLPPDERANYIRAARQRAASLNTDGTALVLYTDGSRKPVNGRRQTGAGLAAVHNGREIHSARIPLGRRAGVYDAEMWALAAGAQYAHNLLTDLPHL
ncbi:hypothetical protein HDZ31DRAFT_13221, partial [Schizophyllum fasciatum]